MNNKKALYSILGAVVLLVLVAAGVYAYQQSTKGDTAANDTDTSNIDSGNSPEGGATDSTGAESDDQQQVGSTSYKSEKGVAITLATPERGGKVASPLKVTGNVPGTWSQEGQFTVRLLDGDSNILAESAATLDGDWMSENPVPFTATLEFEAPAADSTGLLVLQKANPSGMEEGADSLTVPIMF